MFLCYNKNSMKFLKILNENKDKIKNYLIITEDVLN